ncbi:MAG: ATP-binding protein, partial [Thermoanaerobaculia bacterium]
PLLQKSVSGRPRLRFALAPEPLRILGDAARLEQVLFNLVTNAGDATLEKGEILVSTGTVDASEARWQTEPAASAARAIRLEVRDTGVGMRQEVLDHLFEPFFSTKSPDHGSGLGLASVYGIVQQSGGVIRVASEAGQGTQFSVYFPERTDATPDARDGSSVSV